MNNDAARPVRFWWRESVEEKQGGLTEVIHEEEGMEDVDVRGMPFLPEPGALCAQVPWSEGRTIGLGGYSAYRLDGGIVLPCGLTPEAMFKAYRFAADLVAERVKARISKVGLRDPLDNPADPEVRR